MDKDQVKELVCLAPTVTIRRDRFLVKGLELDKKYTEMMVVIDDGLEFWPIRNVLSIPKDMALEMREDGCSFYRIIRIDDEIVLRAGSFITQNKLKISKHKYELLNISDDKKGNYYKINLAEKKTRFQKTNTL